MKITFLGTSAGEEYPCAWCGCEHCAKARVRGGKNIRRNSSVIIDGDAMIDMGKTAHIQAEKFNINLRDIKTLLVTHSHKDHFNTHTLWTRSAAFPPPPCLDIFGSKQVHQALLNNDRYDENYWQVKFNIIGSFKKYIADNLEFFTLDGKHGDGEVRAINYIITRKNITFAYLSDTGWPFNETLEALARCKYDFIITEGTTGLSEGYDSHMGLKDNIRLLEFFSANKLWKNAPDYYVTHVAPHGCPPHDEYAPVLEEKGLTLAYDGLVIEYLYD
jgi:phosphoribosyl 1,2-cyclic phosphate phosphodiesterase